MKARADSQPSNPSELAWENGFAALIQFKAREKHCRVPRGHQEGAFNLGTWVINQRNRRRACLFNAGSDWMRSGLIGLYCDCPVIRGKMDSRHWNSSRRAKSTAEFRGSIEKGRAISALGSLISATEETLCLIDAGSDWMRSGLI
jgi:Helicase associated domain